LLEAVRAQNKILAVVVLVVFFMQHHKQSPLFLTP
jgi:hypothetical protein